MRRFHRGNRDDGASLIEFALIMPLLVLLIFGMVDAGWAFFQNLEVRHGAREAARLAVVNFGDTDAIISETCARMTADDSVWVALDYDGTEVGAKVTVLVVRDHASLTGFLPFFDNLSLHSLVEMRLEQSPPSWSPTAILPALSPPPSPSNPDPQRCT